MNPVVDASWTLFLDRDGVINHEKHADYINYLTEFKFYDNALQALALLTPLFYKTIIVTNQKGIGRCITPKAELKKIHNYLKKSVAKKGGCIDAIFYCADINSNSPNRKPNTGMALQAKLAYSAIDFNKAIMVGNNASDLHFGRNAGFAINILLTTTKPLTAVDPILYDYHFESLFDAALFLKHCVKK
jgi:D-glycero-D-manno-heptose 1,7-bisphosphate phosphatase